ncbi:WecB/TagA/CpsF family glycosyltransferase [Mycobacterium sp. 236(2023)]|uniref:WecB/TagA/CpsF family glycosyltransferase n=1 Tax=Mycobacterium sp. 236(2023) TaxID=3038163 RepID=UPI00241546FD|nr:WecB/TagA/CpsF family glycosyltransferase [Mycobacterium sp. 236(2023)]MDG4665371.1 WecB/TagA/CpsF family glycosyltransferase [Mycobacterium sp. 236(2023)]
MKTDRGNEVPMSRPIVTRYARFDVSTLNEAQVIDAIFARTAPLTPDEPHLVVTPNMNHVARLQASSEFASIYERARLILPDGWPVVRLANSLGTELTARATGSGITHTLAHMPGEGHRLFLVGGSTPASLEAASAVFRGNGWVVESEQAPVGWLGSADNLRVLAERVAAFRADLVLIGVGSPLQERVAVSLLDADGVTAVLMGVGASIDFVAGQAARRAPKWMQRLGIEWLHRILTDPARLLKRYVADVVPFLKVVRQSHAHSGQ